MQLPKLTPLQSRLLASLIASCLLIIIWISFQPHHFVYAADLKPSLSSTEYTYDEIPHGTHDAQILQLDAEEDGSYQPEFQYFDRSIIGRAADGVHSLTNNVKYLLDIKPGDTANFVFGTDEVNGKKGNPGTGLPSDLNARDLDEEELVTGVEVTRNGTGELRRDPDISGEWIEPLAQRQTGRQVYISINTCRQPSANGTTTSEAPPQLTLYISTSQKNQKPGPENEDGLVGKPIPLDGGYANLTLQTSSDVFIGVSAPSVDKNWDGNWHFEIAASIDSIYHAVNDSDAYSYLVDTDSSSTLFITEKLTEENATADEKLKWLNMPGAFTMYAFAQDNKDVKGLERSYCGLQEQFNKAANIQVTTHMIPQGIEGVPRGQFHVQGLNASSKYYGYVALNGNGTTDGLDVPGNAVVTGGGQVWKQFSWTTKSDGNCQVIFNLPFCTSIAHAVPANPSLFPDTASLAKKYDDAARELYGNFNKSLSQIACNTTGTAQYSLARNCSDCASDYKNWLCQVLMPRCEDFSHPAGLDKGLIPRNINAPFLNGSIPSINATLMSERNRRYYNNSRNPSIDEDIKPGPYKELLPCDDLCNNIVRSCPAQLGFGCPEGGARRWSYGIRSGNEFELTCGFPGAVKDLNVPKNGGLMMRGLDLGIMMTAATMVWMLLV
ncbi:hypothetical protein GQ43DRAFT_459976 [Delitschia confertaspora ATCC 74209]|uniref:FZ domain-containing protein n=1 Tax=Delitschia confertaspora ATCC 74209 TaxID=1513339 RepID=A0A9P4JZM3_9PLEO|nr:hypothetical protein GQ43DRAFT_459976 [Delitschia confertaspora ATCC 74209]